jgi:hypothetical protein
LNAAAAGITEYPHYRSNKYETGRDDFEKDIVHIQGYTSTHLGINGIKCLNIQMMVMLLLDRG